MNRQQIKKWSLLRHLNFKGYKRTASGNPLNMVKVMFPSQLTIYGNTIQRNLPEGYTQVEYLQSTGTQWIVTDITSDQDTGIYLEAAFDELLPAGSHDTSGYRLIGCVNNNFGIGEYPGTGEFNFMRKNGTGATVNSDIGVTADTAKHTFKNNYLNDGLFVLDDTEKTAPEATFTNNYGMAIFRTTYNSATNYYNTPCKAKIYRIKISQGAEVVHDIFPCTRDSDSKPGMYDTLTDTFMTNAGTGEFTAGAEVTEPSPDNPIDVQLCGDRTGNLLDASTIYVKNSGGNVDFDGKTIHVHSNSTGVVMWFWTNVYVQQGKTYAIQYSDSTIHLRYAFSTEAITEYSSDVFANTTTIQNKFATFTATETGYLRIVFSLPVNTPDGTIDRLQVIEGSYTADTLPAYEPYGYKVSGRAEGLNLFDTENIIENTEDTTVKIEEYQGKKCLTWTDGSNTSKQHFMQGKFKENTQYTFRFSGYSKNDMQISIVYTDGSYKGLGIQGGEEWNEIIFQSPSGKSIDYWRGWHNYGQKVAIDIDSSMIIEGSYTATTMPPYEPYQPPQDFAVYLPEQIAKVGDVADEVVVDMDKQTAELKKKCFRHDFTGDENWSYEKSYNRFALNLKLGLQSKRYKTPSNRFETTNIADNKDGLIFAYSNKIYLYHYNSTTKEEFNAFLTDNPTYAYIPYSTPVTTDITSLQQWDAMPNITGTVSITFDSTIPISSAETEYYSKEYDAT